MKKSAFMRVICILTALVTLTAVLFACGTARREIGTESAADNGTQTDAANVSKDETVEKIRVGTLIGPTGMGMAYLMKEDSEDKTDYDYEFELMSAPENMAAQVIAGALDVAAVPVNLAATLYKKTEGAYLISAVNTLGVLYVLENGDTVSSVADLAGKTLYCTGQGAMPQYVIEYLISQNGLKIVYEDTLDVPSDSVRLVFMAEHAELAAAMAAGTVALGMLPEPNVTSASMKNASLRVALDVTSEWGKIEDAQLIQGCIIVSKAFAENHPIAYESFLREYKESVEYVNSNVASAADMIQEFGILPAAAIAKSALPRCNIVFDSGASAKAGVEAVLGVLFGYKPALVGGAMPDETFYSLLGK